MRAGRATLRCITNYQMSWPPLTMMLLWDEGEEDSQRGGWGQRFLAVFLTFRCCREGEGEQR